MSVLAGIARSTRHTYHTRSLPTLIVDLSFLIDYSKAEHANHVPFRLRFDRMRNATAVRCAVSRRPDSFAIFGFLGRFSATRSVAWRACFRSMCTLSLSLFLFLSLSLYVSLRGRKGKKRERTKGRNDARTRSDSDGFAREATPAQTLPRTRSVRSSFILAPSRCCPTRGPLIIFDSHSFTSYSLHSIYRTERNVETDRSNVGKILTRVREIR